MQVLLAAIGAVAMALLGCAPPLSSPSSAASQWIEPLGRDADPTTGALIAHVRGNPRDVEYFLNGVRIDPEERIAWWRDAELRLDLRPGFYRLEATYKVRAFAGEKKIYRIESVHPIEVLPGQETLVIADLGKDWRGVPAAEMAQFRVQPHRASKPHVERDSVTGNSSPRTAPEATEPAAPTSDAAPADAPALIVIRGDDAAATAGTIRIESSETKRAPSISSNTLVLRGAQPASPAATPATPEPGTPEASTPAAEASAPAVANSPIAAEPQPFVADLPTTPDVEVGDLGIGAPEAVGSPSGEALQVLGDATGPLVTLSIDSDPAGARVTIGDQDVGRTPVRVRIDPRVDHVLQFETAGCGDYVRLLSASGWREGRNPSVRVQLHCP